MTYEEFDFTKPCDEWSFGQVVDYWAGQIAISIANGQFKTKVYQALDFVLRWKEAQDKKEVKK